MFRKILAAVAVALMLPVTAGASPVNDGPGPGYFASDNVEWVTILPLETDAPGGRLLGKYFYITTSRWLAIYDVSNPIAPTEVGRVVLPQRPQFGEEDVDTNGKILLIGPDVDSTLHVYDVEDKTNPTEIATLPGADEHTISCILKCKYAYGSDGVIVDLRDPAAPEIVGDWGEGMPAAGGHDVTEVAPGLVMTSTQPMMLLDARKDPAHPELLATGANDDGRFIHSNLWPNKMKDKMMLVGGESTSLQCGTETSGAFMTWDMRKWKKTHSFTMIDEYRVTDGLPTEGNAMVHSFCMHWFETHPSYRNGGLVTVAWYEHGTRFLRVSKKGEISEDGYFLPMAGATSAIYWITDEILYAVDYQRGIDILRYTGKP